MKKSKFSEERIIGVLKQVEAGRRSRIWRARFACLASLSRTFCRSLALRRMPKTTIWPLKGLLMRETVDTFVAELNREDLSTRRKPCDGNNKHQNTARLQPTEAMFEEQTLGPCVLALATFPVIWRIQVQQRERLDGQ